MAQPRTGSQRLADLLLQPDGLRFYLADKRHRGASLERIARDLHDDTKGQVSITFRTVRRWLDDLDIEKVPTR